MHGQTKSFQSAHKRIDNLSEYKTKSPETISLSSHSKLQPVRSMVNVGQSSASNKRSEVGRQFRIQLKRNPPTVNEEMTKRSADSKSQRTSKFVTYKNGQVSKDNKTFVQKNIDNVGHESLQPRSSEDKLQPENIEAVLSQRRSSRADGNSRSPSMDISGGSRGEKVSPIRPLVEYS